MEHPAFDFNNPNKIRSLIGVFCTNNPMNFHCDRGDGYEFLADQVLALDRFNPQIAARLLNPLTRWRKFPKKRRNLMKNQLSRIILENDLSRDTYEIASKSLS
jgi:aminopeptidase N